MRRFIVFSAAILLATTAALTQPPSRPDPPLFQADMITGNDPILNPEFGHATEQSSGPVVYDLTGDGLPEVIVTGRTDIWVFDYEHQDPQTPVFHWSVQQGYEFCGPVTVCHPSASGHPWVVAGASKIVHHLANLPIRQSLTLVLIGPFQCHRTAEVQTAIRPEIVTTGIPYSKHGKSTAHPQRPILIRCSEI